MKLSEVGEFGLLALLEARGLATGIGDDTAALPGGLVATQDALVEGVHFRLDRIEPRDLGFRAAAVNISDLAASGARPEALLVALGAPENAVVEDVLELYEGIAEAGVPVVGGDTTRSDRLLLAVTALGRSERVPGRAGARPGDLLVVTGALGASGAAFREGGGYVRPPIRVEEGVRLARTATAMLDVSDGIAQDAGHIAERSGCRVVLDLDEVPLAHGATVHDLGFGEDYELLAAVREPEEFAVVGRCEPGSGVELLLAGRPVSLPGWDHYR